MATKIPSMWLYLTPCLQVTWHGACTLRSEHFRFQKNAPV